MLDDDGISVKSLNQILNVSPNLQIAIYLKNYSSLLSMMLKNISFPLSVLLPTSIWGKDFSHRDG